MHCVQRVLRLCKLYQGVGIDGGKLVVVALRQSVVLGAPILYLEYFPLERAMSGYRLSTVPLHAICFQIT